MNRVDVLGYDAGDPAWFECYLDLTNIIQIRELSKSDKAYRGVEFWQEDMSYLVFGSSIDPNNNRVQNQLGWVVPGNAHTWAARVKEAKMEAGGI